MIDQWTDFKIWCLHYSQCHLSTYIASKKKHWSDMLRDFNSSSICMTDFHLSKKFYCIYFKTYIRPYCPARWGSAIRVSSCSEGWTWPAAVFGLVIHCKWHPDECQTQGFPAAHCIITKWSILITSPVNVQWNTGKHTLWKYFLVEIGGIYLQASTLFPLGCCEARKVTFWLFYWS